MAVNVKVVGEYLNFGKCVEISNGTVDLLVTIDIGPRIIRCGLVGGRNIMFNDVDRVVFNDDESMEKHYYKGAKWNIYGGHRLWASPEKLPDTYYPDCKTVKYEFIENGAIFTPDPQTENGIAMKIKVTMTEGGVIDIMHYITNISDSEKTMSAWALSVLDKGGLEIIAQNTVDTGLLPNRRIIMWPYSNMADSRIYMGDKYITLKQDVNAECAFKLGLDNHSGAAMYVLDDTVFINRYKHNVDGVYDDFGVSFETYTSCDILEMETLGEISHVKPGETITHAEQWEVHKCAGAPDARNEEQIDKFVKQFNK